MAPNDEAIIECLAALYGEATAARALWLWAGGKEPELEYDPDPKTQWTTLWNRAGVDSAASRVFLLREALFDRPGDPELLGFMGAIAEARYAGSLAAASVVAMRIEALAPGFDPGALWCALLSFPENPLEVCLAAAAPSFQGRFPDASEKERPSAGEEAKGPDGAKQEASGPAADGPGSAAQGDETGEAAVPAGPVEAEPTGVRGALEKSLEKIVSGASASVETLAQEIKAMLASIPEMTEKARSREFEALAEKVREVLAPDSPSIEKTAPIVSGIEKLAAGAADDLYRAAALALRRQLSCLKEMAGGRRPSAVMSAQALCQALWATTAKKRPSGSG